MEPLSIGTNDMMPRRILLLTGNLIEIKLGRLEDFSSLKEIIEECCEKEARILILGCGNAEFSEDLYNGGYQNVENIDISQVVID